MSESDQTTSSAHEQSTAAHSPEPSEIEVASAIADLDHEFKAEQPPASPMFESFVKPKKKLPGLWMMLGGVVLPTIALTVEVTWRWCAQKFFDPIPTFWHVLLVAIVPLTNLLVFIAARNERSEYRKPLGYANALALGVAAFYTLVYLPLMPIGVFALIFMGLGILPLIPVLALTATLFARRHLRNLPPPPAENAAPSGAPGRVPGLAIGLLLALSILVASEFRTVLTRVGMQLASSDSGEQSRRGVEWLRSFGSEEVILNNCYERRFRMGDLVSLIFSSLAEPVTTEEARTIFYRVTGRTFSSGPAPRITRRGLLDDQFEFDPDQGGQVVAGRLKGLSLAGSRQDQVVDADAALSYTEWTLVFKNDAALQREARALVALPPGGVVSRLTLWINGEPREAAFAARGTVQQAYQQVVQQRRDPVLVTTAGPDRVRVQCFPVPPNGEMKIRLGITAPLQLESRERAVLRLPYFIERNFGVGNNVQHSVWFEAKEPLALASDSLKNELKVEQTSDGNFTVRGSVNDASLANGRAGVAITLRATVSGVRAHDPLSKERDVITERIEERAIIPPSRVVFVIDESRSMREHFRAITEALQQAPDNIEMRIVIASDSVQDFYGNGLVTSQQKQFLSNWLQADNCEGGKDNVAALLRAMEAAGDGQSAIVWIHGPQPVSSNSVIELRQRWERRPDGPTLYDLQTVSGPNVIAAELEGISSYRVVPPQTDLKRDLVNLLTGWNGNATQLLRVREKIRRASLPAGSVETSSHLARLWANDEVARLMTAGDKKIEDAQKIAAGYQLVTPVSGAVVLETAQQYQNAGLRPVNPNTVPTIPEPETWLLIAVVGAALITLLYRRRKSCDLA